jgi:acetyl esterase/lipase
MAEIGPRWSPSVHIKQMIESFSAVLKHSPKDGVTVRRDVPYGSHPRQMLDIYLPNNNGTQRVAVLFVHGGAFIDGSRNRSDEIFANVMIYFARHGIVGINVGYRLAGDAPYPGGTEDMARVVKWTRENSSRIGVDPSRIFLMGHSAGAAHAGSYAYDKRFQPVGGHGLAGLIVVSGRMRAENRPENPNGQKVVAYYGTSNPEELNDVSPVTHVNSSSVPTFVAWAEYENPLIDVHCAELVFRLSVAKTRTPPVVWLRGHNHSSSIAHFNTAEDMLGRAILDFITDPR